MDEGGTIDKTRGGAGGVSKKRRAFLEAMRTSGQSEFVYSDLQCFADRVNMPVGGFRGAIRRAKCSLESFYLLFSFNSLSFFCILILMLEFVDNLREAGDISMKRSSDGYNTVYTLML